MRDISKIMANSVKMFEAEGAPCGPTLRKGLVTIGGADDFDLNPANRDAKDTLHGTGCALTQLHTSTSTGTVWSVELYHDAVLALSSIAQLPTFYTSMKEVQVSTGSASLYWKCKSLLEVQVSTGSASLYRKCKSLQEVCLYQLLLDLAGHQLIFPGHHHLLYPKLLTLRINAPDCH